MELQNNVSNIVDRICSYLECTQKMVASLIGITESTLSQNLKISTDDILIVKTNKRLEKLFAVTINLESMGLSSKAAFEIITNPCHKDFKGNFYSIQTAIIADKLDIETILVILEDAKQIYTEEKN